MRVDILSPGRRSLTADTDSHSHKCKERSKDLLSIAEEMGVAGNSAELQMKLKIPIRQRLAVTRLRCTAHPLHDGLQVGDVGSPRRGEISSHPFKSRTNLIELNHIFFTELHHPSASARLLGDKALVRENIDGFADRCLGNAEFCS